VSAVQFLSPERVIVVLRSGGRVALSPRGWVALACVLLGVGWVLPVLAAHPVAVAVGVGVFATGVGVGFTVGRRLPGRAVLTVSLAAVVVAGTPAVLMLTTVDVAVRVLAVGALWALAGAYTRAVLTEVRARAITGTAQHPRPPERSTSCSPDVLSVSAIPRHSLPTPCCQHTSCTAAHQHSARPELAARRAAEEAVTH